MESKIERSAGDAGRLLLVSQEADVLQIIGRMGLPYLQVISVEEVERVTRVEPVVLYLVDWRSGSQSITAARPPEGPWIALVPPADADLGIVALEAGAFDFIDISPDHPAFQHRLRLILRMEEAHRTVRSLEHRNAALEEQMQQRRQHAEMTQTFSRQLGRALSYRELLEETICHLHRFVEYDVAAAMLVAEGTGMLFLHAVRPISQGLQESIHERLLRLLQRMNRGIVEQNIDRQSSVVQSILSQPEGELVHQLNSTFQVPLIGSNDRVSGLLFVGAEAEGVLDETQTRRVYMTAGQVSLSIRRLEETLSDELLRLRQLVQNLPGGVLLIGQDHRILLGNPTADEYLLLLTDQRVGDLLTQLGHVALETLCESPGVYREIRTDSRTFEVAAQPAPVAYQSEGWVILMLDVTDRRKAEQALQRYADELVRSNAELQQFAYIASHDLQEPLRVVLSYAQLLRQHCEPLLDVEGHEFMEHLCDATGRMQQLLQGLLAYSRVGTQGLSSASVDVAEVLREVIEDLEFLIEENDVRFEIEPLPTAHVDPTQLAQLLQNLIQNAIKFRRAVSPVIRVSAEAIGQMWQFHLCDNGIGIEPAHLERVFQIFRRLHIAAEYPGTGIGLAICRKVVERHGGRIHLTSEPGIGTCVHFTLPGVPPG